jgi:hypothetical protein
MRLAIVTCPNAQHSVHRRTLAIITGTNWKD